MAFKKLSELGSNEAIKKSKFNKLNTKVNNLEYKVTDVSTLIQTSKYITDKPNLQKKRKY